MHLHEKYPSYTWLGHDDKGEMGKFYKTLMCRLLYLTLHITGNLICIQISNVCIWQQWREIMLSFTALFISDYSFCDLSKISVKRKLQWQYLDISETFTVEILMIKCQWETEVSVSYKRQRRCRDSLSIMSLCDLHSLMQNKRNTECELQ